MAERGLPLFRLGFRPFFLGAAAFAALAAALRVGLAGAAPRLGVALASAAWCVGFGLFVVRYAPMLWRARVDGRPG